MALLFASCFPLIGIYLYECASVNTYVNSYQSISPHTQDLYTLIEALLTRTHTHAYANTHEDPESSLCLP